MALDVVHVDDGVVHHKAQGQDQGEERHPVDGVAEQHVHEKGQGEAHRHGQGHHHGLAAAHGQGQDDHHRQKRRAKRRDQFGNLLLGRLAVVTGDLQGHAVGQDGLFQAFGPGQDVLGHGHGVGAFFLGQGQGHGRTRLPGRFAEPRRLGVGHAAPGVGRYLLGAVFHLGHVAQVDRAALVYAHYQVARLPGRTQKRVRRQGEFPVLGIELPGPDGHVRAPEGVGHLHRRQFHARKPLRVEFHPYLPGQAARERQPGDVRGLGQAREKLLAHAPQVVFVVARRGQGQGHDGHVVDLDRPHQPVLDDGRHEILVHHDGVVQLDQGRFLILAHEKTHRDHGRVGP
ncbi:hypothetical protein ASZ90_000017 [hydrocarbon metagenome]|uniref:Uncharacterized protein n=1 Tax=hydrocarbon metagenome TaxID=938273 RepID=A0A0W8GAC8_9ZZZZ